MKQVRERQCSGFGTWAMVLALAGIASLGLGLAATAEEFGESPLSEDSAAESSVIGQLGGQEEIAAYLASPKTDHVAPNPHHPISTDSDPVAEIRNYLTGQPSGNDGGTAAPGGISLPSGRVILAAAEPPDATSTAAAPTDGRNYVAAQVCTTCHREETQNWAHRIHSDTLSLNPRDQLESRNCQACHGPGSAHLQNVTDPLGIIRFTEGSQNPVEERNGQCQACHRGGERIFWPGSAHESSDLACVDCHRPQATLPAGGLSPRLAISETCFQCHQTQRAEFRRRSHMPVLEGQMTCVDCHNPHGSTTRPLLKADSVNETCYGCHAEKRGPFLFEHAPVRDTCLNCHVPHGSNHEGMLVTARPLLCQQCHDNGGHPPLLLTQGNMATGPAPNVNLMGRSCSVCHSQIHGSNNPSGPRLMR